MFLVLLEYPPTVVHHVNICLLYLLRFSMYFLIPLFPNLDAGLKKIVLHYHLVRDYFWRGGGGLKDFVPLVLYLSI